MKPSKLLSIVVCNLWKRFKSLLLRSESASENALKKVSKSLFYRGLLVFLFKKSKVVYKTAGIPLMFWRIYLLSNSFLGLLFSHNIIRLIKNDCVILVSLPIYKNLNTDYKMKLSKPRSIAVCKLRNWFKSLFLRL